MSKTVQEWQYEIHQLAKDKGWHEEKRNIGEMLALIHSELSEALEEYREFPASALYTEEPRYVVCRIDEKQKPLGFGIELADAVIRIFDMCELLGIDIEEMMEKKHEFNKTRPFRHGGKSA